MEAEFDKKLFNLQSHAKSKLWQSKSIFECFSCLESLATFSSRIRHPVYSSDTKFGASIFLVPPESSLIFKTFWN
uniref:Uncharacterized protein n=1 Tax=Solanum tuberosum TaxID=4113 RepID=M1AJ61_SOLTU